MRSLFFRLSALVMLAAWLTLLSGCGTSATTNDNNSVGAKPANANSGRPTAPPSAYPPLGSDIANAELDLIDGTKTKVTDRKGKVVLLNLWATWCGPCRAEMPQLIAMQDKYRDQGFQIIGLDIGNPDEGTEETVEQIDTFAKKMKLNYELARIKNDLLTKFNKIGQFNGVPQSFLIDREGRLRGVFVGGGPNVVGKMKSTVDSVMAEPPEAPAQ